MSGSSREASTDPRQSRNIDVTRSTVSERAWDGRRRQDERCPLGIRRTKARVVTGYIYEAEGALHRHTMCRVRLQTGQETRG